MQSKWGPGDSLIDLAKNLEDMYFDMKGRLDMIETASDQEWLPQVTPYSTILENVINHPWDTNTIVNFFILTQPGFPSGRSFSWSMWMSFGNRLRQHVFSGAITWKWRQWPTSWSNLGEERRRPVWPFYFIRMVFPSSHHMKCNLCTPGHLKPKPLLNCVGFRSNYMLYTYLIWDRNLYIFGWPILYPHSMLRTATH